MTRKAKLLAYMRNHSDGVTVRLAMNVGGGNSPTKRISELRAMGVQLNDFWVYTEDGEKYKRYRLADRDQPEVLAILGINA